MKYLILPLLLVLEINAKCQSVDYNKIILPESVGVEIDFEEKLVQLAWKNHPGNNIVRRQVEIANQDLKLSRRQWFDIIQFQGNINEFNIDPNKDIYGRADFYPRYNLGARLSLGMFFTIPANNNKQNQLVGVAADELNAQKLRIREEVLTRYNNYLMYKEIYNIQTLAMDDAESLHELSEQAFKQGEESFEVYMNKLNTYNRIKIEKVRSENDFLNAKLSLEEMIGVPLEDVN